MRKVMGLIGRFVKSGRYTDTIIMESDGEKGVFYL